MDFIFIALEKKRANKLFFIIERVNQTAPD